MRGVTAFLVFGGLSSFEFQLTRLMRGVTLPARNRREYAQFQLTRLMRGVTCRLF